MGKYISVNVDVDLDDVFESISTDDLAKELAIRGVDGHKGAVRDAIAQIRRGDTMDAITTLEREFFPKWHSVGDSLAALQSANREAAPAGAAG